VVIMSVTSVKRPSMLSWTVLAANLGGLLSSGSLSSLLACICGTSVSLAAARVPARKILGVMVLLGLAFFVAVELGGQAQDFRSPLERVAQTTGQTQEVATVGVRLETYRHAFQQISSDPFFGSGLDDLSGADRSGTLTHSILLRSWFQGGVSLMMAILLIYTSSAQAVASSLKSGRSVAAGGVLVCLMVF